MTERMFRRCAAALILLMAAIQFSTLPSEAQTWDEGIHLFAGYSYWMTGKYTINPEHPALGKLLCALPLVAVGADWDPRWMNENETVLTAAKWIYRNRVPPEWILGPARGVTIGLTLAFALWIAVWSRRRFGAEAALIALALFCLDPNLIAHGRYVTTDLIASLFIFVAATLWIDYLDRPSPALLTTAGLAAGCALASKYSALFLLPLLILAGLLRRRWLGSILLPVLAALVIVLVYWPEFAHIGSADRLSPHLTGTGPLGDLLKRIAERFDLPAFTYAIGLDRLSEHDAVGHLSYFMGQFGTQGWRWYFPVAILVKTPVGTLLSLIAGLLLCWRTHGRRFDLIFLVAIPIVFLGFAVNSHINIGHRHVLPVYAFLFVPAGVVLARHRRTAAVLVALVAIESLAIYPYYLSFFNFASGGPANGHRYLLDSNLDWGQDGIRLGRWMKQNGVDHVCLSFFGATDLPRYGANYIGFEDRIEDSDCIGAVSATPLYGLYVGPEKYAALRALKPLTTIGYSIYLYDLRKTK